MKRIFLLLIALTLGCTTAPHTGTSDDPLYIYKVEHRLITVDGEQHYVKEVVRVPYNQ